MRLRRVETVDFRKSERTNYMELMEKNKEISLGPADVILFLSMNRDQLCFVWRPESMGKNGIGNIIEVLTSKRVRIKGGSWEPRMLVNYAQQAGLELLGLKSFEQHHRHLIEAKAEDES